MASSGRKAHITSVIFQLCVKAMTMPAMKVEKCVTVCETFSPMPSYTASVSSAMRVAASPVRCVST